MIFAVQLRKKINKTIFLCHYNIYKYQLQQQ